MLLPRLALALRRAPQYDELFTVWIARKPFGPMMETLRLDSGPPLYYLIVRAFRLLEVSQARALSLVVAVLGAVVCCLALEKTWQRLLAGAMLAVYPLHVHFATEARAYALCALLVGIAATAMDRWVDTASRRWLAVAVIALLAGAYAHHYVLFLFTVPIAFALLFRRDRLRDAALGTLAMTIAFLPGAILLRDQLPNAVPWMRIEDDFQRVVLAAGSVTRIGFDGRQPIAAWLQVIGGVALLLALAGSLRSPRARRYLTTLALALGGAMAAAVLGLPAYFPLRFESVLAVPAVLWVFFALTALPRIGLPAIAWCIVVGAVATASLLSRPAAPSALQLVVDEVLSKVPVRQPLIASGPVYLALSLRRDVTPLPAAHAVQPGRELPREVVAAEAARLPVPFIFVGSQESVAYVELSRARRVRVLARAADVVAARVE